MHARFNILMISWVYLNDGVNRVKVICFCNLLYSFIDAAEEDGDDVIVVWRRFSGFLFNISI